MYCVYKIKFSNSKIYIGQTNNYKSRMATHISNGIIKKMVDSFPDIIYSCKIIENDIDESLINEREKFYIRQYQNNSNYTILNKYLVKRPTRLIIYQKHNQIKVFIDDNNIPLYQTTYKPDKFYKSLGKMISKYNKWCDEQYSVCNLNIEYH